MIASTSWGNVWSSTATNGGYYYDTTGGTNAADNTVYYVAPPPPTLPVEDPHATFMLVCWLRWLTAAPDELERNKQRVLGRRPLHCSEWLVSLSRRSAPIARAPPPRTDDAGAAPMPGTAPG